MKKKLIVIACLVAGSGISTMEINEDKEMRRPVRVQEEVVHEVIITAYQPVPEQCDEDPLVTADGSRIDLNSFPKNWIAVSRDFLNEKGYKYGDLVYIEVTKGNLVSGVYEIHDTMHPRWTNRIDVLIPPDEKAGKWEGTVRRV